MTSDEISFKRWRALILCLVLVSLAALIAIAWLEPSPWEELRSRVVPWEHQSPGPLSRMEAPPRWLSISGILLAANLSGILLIYLFPTRVRLMGETFSRPVGKLARLALLGLAGVGLVLAVSISATFAIATFPLAIFLGSLMFLAGFSGMVSLAYALGKALLLRAAWGHLSPVVALLLGSFLLLALNELPVLGVVFRVFILFLGSGVVIATRFGTGQPWSLEPMNEG